MAAAAALVPSLGRRVFLSVGARSLEHFSGLRDSWFLVRLIDTPDDPLPLPQAKLITGRGPFDAASEHRILEQHRIELLVTRASGGAATEGKIDAARALGLPVILVRLPAPPPGGDYRGRAGLAGARPQPLEHVKFACAHPARSISLQLKQMRRRR